MRTEPSVIERIPRLGARGQAPSMSPIESTAAIAPLQAPATALRAPGTLHVVDGDVMNSSERFGFWLYAAMGVFCMAVLVAAAAAATLA
jgi:hypothetical protein